MTFSTRYPWNVGWLVQAVPMYHSSRRRYNRVMKRRDADTPPGAMLWLGDDEYELIGGYVSTSNPYALWDWRGVRRDDLVKDLAEAKTIQNMTREQRVNAATERLAKFDEAHRKQGEYDQSGYEFVFAAYKEDLADLLAETHSVGLPYPVPHPRKRIRDIDLHAWQIVHEGDGGVRGFYGDWRWGRKGGCTVSMVEDHERPGLIHGLVEWDAGVLRKRR